MRGFILGFAAVCLAVALSIGGAKAQSVSENPFDQIQRAAELFGAGQRDEAAYLYYIAQLRVRIYIEARPDLPPSGAPALAGSLFEVVGRPINEWIGGDVDEWVSIMDRVLAWHAANDDAITPKATYGDAHRTIVSGLRSFRNQVDGDRESIRAQREANGLPNR
ncbi:MAG: hypothetical protein AAFO77_01460 [Pseudomonadota bacterium]